MAIGFLTVLKVALVVYSLYRTFRNDSKDKKKITNSNTYNMGGWKPSASQEKPLPLIFGTNKITGNWIWRTPTDSEIIYGALGLAEGEITKISDIKIDKKDISILDGCSSDSYLGTETQSKDSRFSNGNSAMFLPTDDSYIRQDKPTTNYGTARDLYGAGATKRIYLMFDLSSLPDDLNILSANLSLYFGYNVHHDVYIEGMFTETSIWSEDSIVWGDDSGWSLTEVCSEYSPFERRPGRRNLDIKTWLNDNFDSSKPYLTLKITAQFYDVWILSKETSTQPYIQINYTSTIENCCFRHTSYLALTLKTGALLSSVSDNDISMIVDGLPIRNWDTEELKWQTTFNNNPVWVILYLMTDGRRGIGIEDSKIDLDSFKTVAEVCDEYILSPDGKYEKRYSFDFVFDNEDSAAGLINDIEASCGIFHYEIDGKIYLGIDSVWTGAKSLFDESTNILEGSFQFFQIDKTDFPNEIKLNFIDSVDDFSKNFVKVSDDISQELKGKISKEITIYGINRRGQASRIAQYYLNKGRLTNWACEFSTGNQGAAVAPGDVIKITHSDAGWIEKEMRVISSEETYEGEFHFYCEEYNAEVYDDSGLPCIPNFQSNLPNPEGIPPAVTNLILSETHKFLEDGTYIPQIEASWTAADSPFTLKYLVWLKKTEGGSYELVTSTENTTTKIDVEGGGILYYVMIQSKNNRTGNMNSLSDCPADSITIVGKDSKPSDVTFREELCKFENEIYLEWDKINDSDLAFYEVRTDSNWGNPTNLIYQGKVTNFIMTEPSSLSYTFYLKARDNSGNYSENADSVTLTNSIPTMTEITADFTTKDCVLNWSAVLDKDFYEYVIEVYSDSGYSNLLRTIHTKDNFYNYTFDVNKTDFGGTPSRNVYFRIYVYDRLNQFSYQSCAASNTQPSAPTAPVLTAYFGSIKIDWTALTDIDILQYNIYAGVTSNPTTLIASINSTSYNWNLTGSLAIGTTVYVKISASDPFGESTKSAESNANIISINLAQYNLEIPLISGIVFSYEIAEDRCQWTEGQLAYKGVVYTISSGYTGSQMEYIWWDKDVSPTTFQHSTVRPAIGADIWLMCYFDYPNKKVYPCTQIKILHAGILQASSITAELIGVNEVIANTANIKDGIITDAKIISLSTSKLTVSIGANLIYNSNFETMGFWSGLNDVGSDDNQWHRNKDKNRSGAYSLGLLKDGEVNEADIYSPYIPVDISNDYLFSFYYQMLKFSSLSTNLKLYLKEYDEDKSLLDSTLMKEFDELINDWDRFYTYTNLLHTDFNAGTKYIRFELISAAEVDMDFKFYATEFMLQIMDSVDQTPSAWQPSTFTYVDAKGIITPNLSAISADIGTVIAGLIQSANNKVKFDLTNSYIKMEDGLNSIVLDENGLIGKYSGAKTFDLGTVTGRGFFKGGLIGGRISSIPLQSFAFETTTANVVGDEITLDDGVGNSFTLEYICYAKGCIWVTMNADDGAYGFYPVLAQLNCNTNDVDYYNLLEILNNYLTSSYIGGKVHGICYDSVNNYICCVVCVSEISTSEFDEVWLICIDALTSEIIEAWNYPYAADMPEPEQICFDGECIYITDNANNIVPYFSSTAGFLGGISSITGNTIFICFDGTYLWASNALNKLSKINASTKTLVTQYSYRIFEIIFDGIYLWSCIYDASDFKIIKINPEDGTTLKTVNLGAYQSGNGLCTDGHIIWACNCLTSYIWMIDIYGNDLGKEEALVTPSKPKFICYDGLNIWFISYDQNRIRKIPH